VTVVAVFNPISRRASRGRDALVRASVEFGVTPPTFVFTSPDATGAAQARRAVEEGASAVIAVGGDGTVRDVATALAGTSVPLGVVPTGTTNLFAINVGLPRRDLLACARVALGGSTRAVDVGVARAHRVGADATEHPFLFVAGIGNDAATLADVSVGLKRRIGWLAYLVAGARHLCDPLLDLVVDAGEPRGVRTWSVLAGNGGRLPLGIRVFQHDRIDDGVLNTLVLPLRTPWQWVWVAATGVLGRPFGPLEYGASERLRVAARTPAPAQVDGDPIGDVTALEMFVLRGALVVRVAGDALKRGPQAWTTTSTRWKSFTSV
jgi:diacylglycerol kinase family enzyme